MVVAATDSGRPSRTTEVNVFVGVDKINPPVFLGTPYTRLLEERTLNGTSIITVRTSPSTDIVYEIVGEPPAPYLFFVEDTGDIHIKKDLTTDKSMEYKVLYIWFGYFFSCVAIQQKWCKYVYLVLFTY